MKYIASQLNLSMGSTSGPYSTVLWAEYQSTFIPFYLKDATCKARDLFFLGLVVATQHKV